jgi:hypothetical protein
MCIGRFETLAILIIIEELLKIRSFISKVCVSTKCLYDLRMAHRLQIPLIFASTEHSYNRT